MPFPGAHLDLAISSQAPTFHCLYLHLIVFILSYQSTLHLA